MESPTCFANGASFDYAVKVAADSWEMLRKSGVYRIFSTYDDKYWSGIFKVLKEKRPDLVGEAREVMADLEADMHSSWRAE